MDVLLYEDEGGWAAHCLQLDLVECADTPETAMGNMLDVIRVHVEYAIENDNVEYLFHPAPPDVWKRFLTSKWVGSQTIHIETRPNMLSSVVVQESTTIAHAA